MYKYLSDKEDKMETLHNIQEATTVEDIAINIPRLYVALEDLVK